MEICSTQISTQYTCSKFLCQHCQESSRTGTKAKRLMLVCAYQCLTLVMSWHSLISERSAKLELDLSSVPVQLQHAKLYSACSSLNNFGPSRYQNNVTGQAMGYTLKLFLIPSWLLRNQNVSSFLGNSCIEGDASDYCDHQKYKHKTSLMALKECERCQFLVEIQWLRQACCWVNHASCETRCWKLEV